MIWSGKNCFVLGIGARKGVWHPYDREVRTVMDSDRK